MKLSSHHVGERIRNWFNRVGETLRDSLPPGLRFWARFKREQFLGKWREVRRRDHPEQKSLPADRDSRQQTRPARHGLR